MTGSPYLKRCKREGQILLLHVVHLLLMMGFISDLHMYLVLCARVDCAIEKLVCVLHLVQGCSSPPNPHVGWIAHVQMYCVFCTWVNCICENNVVFVWYVLQGCPAPPPRDGLDCQFF